MKHDTVPMLWKIYGPLLIRIKGVNVTIGNILYVDLHAWKHALELRSRALARATSCFCPADRGAPPSARVISNPRGFDSTTLAKWARLKAAHMSMSLCLSKGSKLLRIVPVNNTGTCVYTLYYATYALGMFVLLDPIRTCRFGVYTEETCR